MAEAYIQALRSVQASGPYHLVGWSAGGTVALEVARKLLAQQREVELLVWFDTPMPTIYDHLDLDDDALFLRDLLDFVNRFAGTSMSVSYDELRQLDKDKQFERALREAQAQKFVPQDVSAAYIRHLVDVAKAHVRFIKHYRVEPIDVPVHLFRPTENCQLEEMSGMDLGDDLGWRKLLGERLHVHRAAGDHFSMMMGDNAATLAREIAALTAVAR
jgi:myxalamid-type polyketide synthase MxaB